MLAPLRLPEVSGFIFPLFPEMCLNPGLSWTSVGTGQGWGLQPGEEKKLWVALARCYLLACSETFKVQARGVGAGRRLSAARPRAPCSQGAWDTKDSGSPCGEETGELKEIIFFPCLGLFSDPSEPLPGAEPPLPQLCGQTQVALCP